MVASPLVNSLPAVYRKCFTTEFRCRRAGSSTTSATAPAAATSVPAQDDDANSEMIRGMVSRLADRLKQDGADFDGWMRLVRSYVVLGERDKVVAAAADARRTIGNDTDKRRRFDEFVKSLGLEGTDRGLSPPTRHIDGAHAGCMRLRWPKRGPQTPHPSAPATETI